MHYITNVTRWWLEICLFSPQFGKKDFQFDKHILQWGWFNHQLGPRYPWIFHDMNRCKTRLRFTRRYCVTIMTPTRAENHLPSEQQAGRIGANICPQVNPQGVERIGVARWWFHIFFQKTPTFGEMILILFD